MGRGPGWSPARPRLPQPRRLAARGPRLPRLRGSRRGYVLQMEPPTCRKARLLPGPAGMLYPPGPPPRAPSLTEPPVPLALSSHGGSGRVGGAPGEWQPPLLDACPDLPRMPGIAAGLAAGLGCRGAPCTRTHTYTLAGSHLPSHLSGSLFAPLAPRCLQALKREGGGRQGRSHPTSHDDLETQRGTSMGSLCRVQMCRA